MAATVQPAVVAANRGLVQMLAATNFFGMNWPAIMDTESAYEQMWALDVAAMANYHVDASAAAAQLAPWQQVLRNLGIDISKNGQINFGFGNTGSGNLGNNNFGNNNLGSGNTGSGNVGSGNTGSSNVGVGNTGNNNLGLGNLGSNSVGFGNTGSESFGMGLTGDSKFGFGGFNSGSGNTGFGNSGTGNTGFFNSGSGNMGLGNSGSLNTGLGNSGSGQHRLRQLHELLALGHRRLWQRGRRGRVGRLCPLRHGRSGHRGVEFGPDRLGTGQHRRVALRPGGRAELGPEQRAGHRPGQRFDRRHRLRRPRPVTANATSSAAANAGLRTAAGTPVTGFINPASTDSAVRPRWDVSRASATRICRTRTSRSRASTRRPSAIPATKAGSSSFRSARSSTTALVGQAGPILGSHEC